MKKTVVTILSFCASVAAFLGVATSFCADEKTLSASASTLSSQTTLVAPATYKEYLPLNTPTDVAISEDYTAIADGNVIYVYDERAEEYTRFEHTTNLDPNKNNVTKIQFDENDNLYFLGSDMKLYTLNVKTGEQKAIDNFPCTTFYLHADELFYTTASGGKTIVSKTRLSAPDQTTAETLARDLSGTPALAYADGQLYFTDESFNTHLYKVTPSDPTTITELASFPTAIVSMAISGSAFVCTTEESKLTGDFYAYPLSDIGSGSNFIADDGGYSSIAVFGKDIYVVHKNSVVCYDAEKSQFTPFEISGSSDSVNRLNGASELLLLGDSLFIADVNNDRISVYDRLTETFKTPIATDFEPIYLASDGTTLLAAGKQNAAVYSLQAGESYGKLLKELAWFSEGLVGVAGVYGTYYFLTSDNLFTALRVTETDGVVHSVLTEEKKTTPPPPKMLTSDAYGNLYVVCANDVYRYSQENFLNPAQTGEKICAALPAQTQKIAVDYDRNLYALAQNQAYKFQTTANGSLYEQTKRFPLDEKLVYGNGPIVSAFTMDILENETYYLCDGAYIAKTEKLQLPTVKNVPVNGVDERIFKEESAEFSVVETLPNSLFVEFELQRLRGAETFPYLSFHRQSESVTALKLGETEEYFLLAYFNEKENAYFTYLVRSEFCVPLASDEYRKVYAENERVTGYLTNAIPLYKFPYLTDLLTASDLPRGAQVTLLGEIDKLDHAYYHVSYTDANGKTQTGYIPKAYTILFDGLPPVPETENFGNTESDRDSVSRFAYLVLGFAAICILVDYLLLRKKKED